MPASAGIELVRPLLRQISVRHCSVRTNRPESVTAFRKLTELTKAFALNGNRSIAEVAPDDAPGLSSHTGASIDVL